MKKLSKSKSNTGPDNSVLDPASTPLNKEELQSVRESLRRMTGKPKKIALELLKLLKQKTDQTLSLQEAEEVLRRCCSRLKIRDIITQMNEVLVQAPCLYMVHDSHYLKTGGVRSGRKKADGRTFHLTRRNRAKPDKPSPWLRKRFFISRNYSFATNK